MEIHELNDAIRQIFNTLVKSKSTLIVHNGLLDLMFLYHSFYAPLPLSINQFVGDLSEMFECIYDTKVCSEYIVRNRSTFLAYLYKKSERDNQLKERFSIDVQNKIPLLPNDMTRESKNLYLNRKRKLDTLNYCGQYATHGHCYQGKACEKSHDLDVILDHHEQQVVEESSKKIKTNLTMNEKTVVLEDTMTLKPEIDHSIKIKSRQEQRPVDDSSFEQYHSASFDAFMTGYIHASQLCQGQAQETKNKVFLMGKDYPLLVKRSVYEKLSEQHIAKMKKMNS